jgi:hypothetical protein
LARFELLITLKIPKIVMNPAIKDWTTVTAFGLTKRSSRNTSEAFPAKVPTASTKDPYIIAT